MLGIDKALKVPQGNGVEGGSGDGDGQAVVSTIIRSIRSGGVQLGILLAAEVADQTDKPLFDKLLDR